MYWKSFKIFSVCYYFTCYLYFDFLKNCNFDPFQSAGRDVGTGGGRQSEFPCQYGSVRWLSWPSASTPGRDPGQGGNRRTLQVPVEFVAKTLFKFKSIIPDYLCTDFISYYVCIYRSFQQQLSKVNSGESSLQATIEDLEKQSASLGLQLKEVSKRFLCASWILHFMG